MKRKIVAIIAIIMMVSISFGTVNARGASKKSDGIQVIFEKFLEDGTVELETISLTEEEFNIFENSISKIFDKLRDINDMSQVLELLRNLVNKENQPLSKVLKLFTKSKLFKNRAFVFSQGSAHEIGVLNKNQVKIRKRSVFWRYGINEGIGAKTFILKPFRLKSITLNGAQFGFMHKFTGFYMHISRSISKYSYTFFMGTAKNAIGLDFQP